MEWTLAPRGMRCAKYGTKQLEPSERGDIHPIATTSVLARTTVADRPEDKSSTGNRADLNDFKKETTSQDTGHEEMANRRMVAPSAPVGFVFLQARSIVHLFRPCTVGLPVRPDAGR